MAKEPLKITINEVEYTEDQLTDEQKVLVNHVANLDQKISSTHFQLQQLQGGRQFFMNELEKSLESETVEATDA